MNVIKVVADGVKKVMDALMPIISFIGDLIAKIMEIISPVVSFVSDIINKIVSFITPLIDTVSSVFGNIFDIVSNIMGGIGEFMGGIFNGIESAWDGLKGFVSGIFDGISNAFDALVGVVKGVINGVIGAINGAIWVINLIPGVNIGEIPYLARGTDDWQGGFAYMNEGGRGELTYLPNGAQVIPHDISVKYAKEAARANTQAPKQSVFTIDYDRLSAGMARVRLTPVMGLDGERVSQLLGPYTDENMNTRMRMTARGMM